MAVDAEGAVKAWINGLPDLVGPGRPLPLGAHLTRLRSPGKGAYAFLIVVSGTRALAAEQPVHAARISAMIHGTTRESAARAAAAYTTVLEQMEGVPAVMGEDVICHSVTDVTGPLATDEHDSNREQYVYVVDADFFLQLAAA